MSDLFNTLVKNRRRYMYKIIVEFHDTNILSINADEPNVAAQNIRKLFDAEKARPQIRTINVYNEEDDIKVDIPIHITKVY
jgi:hypothetical protein